MLGLFCGYMPDQPLAGTDQEIKTFWEVKKHYDLAKQDLDVRIRDFDKKDILFRSHIEESKWPYKAMVFDPRVFTALYEKSARILANKPRGRMIPREGGDVLKAKINNEILSFQWDDNERVDGMSMITKWAQMDLSARKYGAAFGLAKWRWERQVVRMSNEENPEESKGKAKIFYDGPNFTPLNNRDCLPNPSYPTIKNWFQHREYVTVQELMDVNDSAKSKPVYKNLDALRTFLKQEAQKGGDTRATNYTPKNLAMKGLSDFLGQDEVYKVLEVVTEYRPDRWITFSPKHGVVIRDIPNPYDHGQIPVVALRYYPIDDDIYGLSEIEPIEKLQRAINALVCQYLDAINMSLYAPLKIRSVGGAVQMHTLQFGPGAKWLMTDPSSDVITHDQNIGGVTEFGSTYRFLVGAMQEALGETSQGVSGLDPGSGKKTATEIKDTALSRSARDNFNQIFLGEALKKQMMFWHKMNQQFFFSDPNEKDKIIQIVGKDAIKYFQQAGLDGMGLDDESTEMLAQNELVPPEEKVNIMASDLETPLYPVETGMGMVPKMEMDDSGQVAKLHVEPNDLSGNYDYIPDVASMEVAYNQEEIKAKTEALSLLSGTDPATGQPTGINAMLAQEGIKVKIKDLLIDHLEDIGFKNADQYFESVQQMGGAYGQQVIPGGAGGPQAVGAGMANGQQQGMGAGVQAVPNGQAPGVVPGPGQVYA